MSEIIAVANQKGGVGKTTTAVNLAASLALAEKKVLLIDFDPQSNATTSLGFQREEIEFDIYHVLMETRNLSDIIQETAMPHMHLAPSNIGLVGIEKEFYTKKSGKELLLKKAIQEVREFYDFIIIDAPPALGPLTINALSASDSVIVPIQCEFFALEGLAQLLSTIQLLQNNINPKLRVKGILPTMYSMQNNLSKQVLTDISNHFKNKLFKNANNKENPYVIIPRSVKLAESPSFGKPILLYDVKSNGSIAYQKLAQSILCGA